MDEALLLALNDLRALLPDRALTIMADWALYAFPLYFIARHAQRPRVRETNEALRDGWLAFLLAIFVAETVVKPLVRRPRPTAIPRLLAELDVLGRTPPATSLSFPSGTAAACAACVVCIWLRFGPRHGAVALVCALVIGLSRVVAGVHYPSDILGGLVVGALVGFVVDRFSRRAAKLSPS